MRAFRFELERVRRVRAVQEDAAQGRMALAIHAAEGERRRLQDLSGLQDQWRDQWMDRVAGLLDVEHVRWCRQQYAASVAAVRRQAGAVADAESCLESRRVELVEARKKRRLMDRLRERRLLEHRQRAERQEQRGLDEIGTQQHHAKSQAERR
ncbi:MAG: flagellar export protein FliJ [Bacillota bacterium]